MRKETGEGDQLQMKQLENSRQFSDEECHWQRKLEQIEWSRRIIAPHIIITIIITMKLACQWQWGVSNIHQESFSNSFPLPPFYPTLVEQHKPKIKDVEGEEEEKPSSPHTQTHFHWWNKLNTDWTCKCWMHGKSIGNTRFDCSSVTTLCHHPPTVRIVVWILFCSTSFVSNVPVREHWGERELRTKMPPPPFTPIITVIASRHTRHLLTEQTERTVAC